MALGARAAGKGGAAVAEACSFGSAASLTLQLAADNRALRERQPRQADSGIPHPFARYLPSRR